jgi:aerobic-type carbon monoxide dehydrogenase small subunit (CoxS/CutS family)
VEEAEIVIIETKRNAPKRRTAVVSRQAETVAKSSAQVAPASMTVTTIEPDSFTLIKLNVNGSPRTVKIASNWTLARVLRDELGLTGTKMYCDRGSCGHCTVIMDGRAILSCMTLAISCDGRNILTIEGMAKGEELHPIQQAWLDEMGYQCGACTPGMIMSAKALLDKTPHPTEDEIRLGMSGNLCLCGNYRLIMKAVKKAATLGGS